MERAEITVAMEWCAGSRHGVGFAVPREGKPENMDELIRIDAGRPQPCLVVNGAALCVVCLQFWLADVGAAFAQFCEELWLGVDTIAALEAAAELTGGASA